MPKLPAAGTRPSSILARTPGSSPIHRVVPVQVVMPGGHAPLALCTDAGRCSSRQSLAALDALHAPARVGAVARLVPTARIIFASHLCSPLTSQEPAGCRPTSGPTTTCKFLAGLQTPSSAQSIRGYFAAQSGRWRPESAGFRTTSRRPVPRKPAAQCGRPGRRRGRSWR